MFSAIRWKENIRTCWCPHQQLAKISWKTLQGFPHIHLFVAHHHKFGIWCCIIFLILFFLSYISFSLSLVAKHPLGTDRAAECQTQWQWNLTIFSYSFNIVYWQDETNSHGNRSPQGPVQLFCFQEWKHKSLLSFPSAAALSSNPSI